MTSAVLGDGGIYSSLDDMFLWDQSLYSSPLVSPSAVTLAFAPARLNNDSTIEYGFGWRLKQYRGERCVYHPGSTIGFRNHFERYPEKHFSVLIFINRDNGQPELLVQKIVDMILFNE
jgi:CubicO group peptidase (beta-lactamase class C family)